jgi:hypothetical protein
MDNNVILCIVFHHGEGAVMNKKVAFLACLLLPLSVWSMSPLTETDLSNVSNPLSISINPDQRIKINNKPNEWDDSEGLNQLSLTSSGLRFHFDINLFEDPDETIEGYAYNLFSSFSWLRVNNTLNNVQIFIIDPVTGESYITSLYEDPFPNNIRILSNVLNIWEDKTTGINAEDANRYYSNSQATGKPSMLYPIDRTQSSNDPYSYVIKSGNIDMRDTYINSRSTTIQSGSWVNIKTR